MWLQKIFAREFGFSDVQSNYSRVYAWMANQLGHMTLGLATTLVFVWIAETIYTLAGEWIAGGGWYGGFCRTCDANQCGPEIAWSLAATLAAFGCFVAAQVWSDKKFGYVGIAALAGVFLWAAFSDCEACWNYTLLSFAALVMAGAFAFVCYKGVFFSGPSDEGEKDWADRLHAEVKRRVRLLGPNASRALFVVVFAGGVLVVWSLTPDLAPQAAGTPLDRPPFPEAPRDPVMIFAIAVTVMLFATGCATLCKDWRFVVIGGLALLGAFMVATAGYPFYPAPPGPGVDPFAADPAFWLAIAFFGASVVTMMAFAMPAERFDAEERLVQLATNLGIAVAFACAIRYIHEPEWRVSFAAAAASLTLWWVKEFGSDLPNVHAEIATVALKRPNEVLGDCSDVERDYFADARMDARTDGLFYFAGVWIGAGVLTDKSVLVDGSWRSGSEILGLLVFLGIFLGMGKNWAYRQLALDLIGADMASRLAVFRSALWLTEVNVAKGRFISGRVGAGGLHANPLLLLRDFAGDIGDPAKPQSGFDHLLVFGARGSGRSPLGRAIASEAALADWPTIFLSRRRQRANDGHARTARFIPAGRLLNYLDDIRDEMDIGATPTVSLFVEDGTKRAGPVRPAGETACREEPPASLVVIDDVASAALGDAEMLDDLLARLNVGGGQQTVWLIDIEEPAGPDWAAALAEAAKRAEPLIARLAEGTPPRVADDSCRIGLALTRRTPTPRPVL